MPWNKMPWNTMPWNSKSDLYGETPERMAGVYPPCPESP
jgi:hypothetical protein